MAAQTGRTVSKFVNCKIDDSGGTLRQIAVDSIGGVGITFDEMDLTSFQDAVKVFLPNLANVGVDITGPFDTTALTGSHTVLSGVNGGFTPLSFGVWFGERHTYEEGEPVWGITSTAANGFLCTSYIVDPSTMKYTAHLVLAPGSALPAWGTASIT